VDVRDVIQTAVPLLTQFAPARSQG